MGATISTGETRLGFNVATEPSVSSESARLLALSRYDLIGTPPEGALDRIVGMAARDLSVRFAALAFVDADRIWCGSVYGMQARSFSLSPESCGRRILGAEPWIVEDAARDDGAGANPILRALPELRFYAGVPLRTQDGFHLGVLCVLDDAAHSPSGAQIHALQNLAALVMDVLELRLGSRREVAESREADHRVMNSLQFISAMLGLQARAADSDEVREQLDAAAQRVAAVARVHRNFYVDAEVKSLGCLDYLRRLCTDLGSILQTSIEVEGAEATVPSKQMQPIGLLVNELVTNAAKHGGGVVKVSFGPAQDGELALSVSDTGAGLPNGFSTQSGGLGMRLVSALTRQLRGRLQTTDCADGHGACFTVVFPGEQD